jgi:Dyp-type peroxidase family
MTTGSLDLADIQGIAFYAYSEHPYSKYLHVSLAYDDARTYAWLRALLADVRHARAASDRGFRNGASETVHVAFTARGLLAFGLMPDDLEPFPREFLLGMNDDERSRKLGDSQERWEFGAKKHDAIHALVMLYARTEAALAELVAEHRQRLRAAGARIVYEDEGRTLPGSREHFGFHDGISEPHVEGGPRTRRSPQPSLPPGELLLGHEDTYGQTTPAPRVRNFDLGTNGTFLVYRKLRQKVGTFWEAMRQRTRPRDGETEEQATIRLAASLVGRWPGGAPLVVHPHRDPKEDSSLNDFAYAKLDPHGHRCPLGAHARRAFPRDMLAPSASESMTETSRHRLFRRGRPYGPPRGDRPPWEYRDSDDARVDRGLVFIALCASLRRQFEFIQQTWVNSHKFAGLYDERDPMIGGVGAPLVDGAPPEQGRFTLQGEPVRRCVIELPRFVELLGGGYFFLPGMRALEWLATPGR